MAPIISTHPSTNTRIFVALAAAAVLASGCGRRNTDTAPSRPPFAVSGELQGLVITYFDSEGAHVAASRSAVPVQSREHVRVDSLSIGPGARDADLVWIADVRREGNYPVRSLTRAAFDDLIDDVTGVNPQAAATPQVVVYGASWCPACNSAKRWLTQQGIPFVDHDIEREPGARDEMQRKGAAAGISTAGIPVLEVRGQMMAGFDPNEVRRLLDSAN